MKTFLDEKIHESKTFILYGDFNDTICCKDLLPRNFEQYLVKYLKSRGYKHIIFYGEGTKGAYCIDEESSRFFFQVNESIPLPRSITNFEEKEKEINQRTDKKRSENRNKGNSISSALNDLMFDDGEYKPGDLSGNVVEEQLEEQSASYQIKYSYPGMSIYNFTNLIYDLMLKKDSHMAVVFNNLFSTRLTSKNINDSILKDWEMYSEGNICLIMCPETCNNERAVENLLRQNQLDGKFMVEYKCGEYMLNPNNCIKISYPNVDEIKNLLRYFSFVGTNVGNRITFDYHILDEIAYRVQYASGKNKNNGEKFDNLKKIKDTLEKYINARGGLLSKLHFSPQIIDEIYGIKDEKKAIEELRREGWEDAYQKVNDAVNRYKKIVSRLDNQKIAYTKDVDCAVERISYEKDDNNSKYKVPNFVLLGNPGTGKKTIARMIGKILQEAGILKLGHTIEATKEKVTSIYVGGNSKNTMKQVELAHEGVLFIDEAHHIGSKDGGANHEGTGVEVVSTLNAAMTNPNYRFSLILAGYGDKMEKLLDIDRGFKHRFEDNFIVLNDYSPDLLKTILVNELEKRGFRIDKSLLEEKEYEGVKYEPLQSLINQIYQERDREKFGNAAEMEKLADYVEGKNKDGVIKEEDFYAAYNGKIIKESFLPLNVGASIDKVMKELEENFVGMHKVKQQIYTVGLQIEESLAKGRKVEDIFIRPIILKGNPGTGKDSLAKLLPKLFFHYNLLGTNKPIFVSASELASSSVGGTQEKVNEYIKQAQDCKGFLFVNEAHELLNPHFDGRGAFKAFMAPTTDRLHPFIACFAVYPDKFDEFMSMDPGAKRRFTIFELEDYTGKELYQILKLMMKKSNDEMSDECDKIIQKVCNRIYLTREPDTGNAGKMEQLLKEMAALRVRRLKNENVKYNDSKAYIFEVDDIPIEYKEGLEDIQEDAQCLVDNILEKFEKEVVGMSNVKKEIKNVALELKESQVNGFEMDDYLRPMIFVGNPGTGKSKIASIIPRIYNQFNLLYTPVPIKISASQLASRYMGGSQEIIREHIAQAQKKRACLFVDEAHELLNEHFDGRGAFKAFMEPTTDLEHPFLACFAVYPEHLDDFLGLDDGSSSRFRIIHLDDYNSTELYQIMEIFMKQKGRSIDDEAKNVLQQVFDNFVKTKTKRSGNGRMVERLFEDMNRERRRRCEKDSIAFNSEESRKFVVEDIPFNLRKNISYKWDISPVERWTKLKEEIETCRVGCKELKNILIEKANILIYQEKYPNRKKVIEPGHYFFTGNPGTGKTTGTKYFAHYLYELGLIQSEEPVIISASRLIGEYMGHTETKTRERLENSVGRVLMIDEAYALASKGHGDSYKESAVNEIVNFLDNEAYRNVTCVVFCGYKGDMDELYASNDGLKSRITEVAFENFDLNQSMLVLKSMLKEEQLELNENSEAECNSQINEMMKYREFANGRTIRRYAQYLSNNVMNRCIQNDYKQEDINSFQVLEEDVECLEEVLKYLNITY